VGDLPILVTAITTFAVVGVGIGMLVARRLDRWAAAEAEQPEKPEQPEEPGADDRLDDRPDA